MMENKTGELDAEENLNDLIDMLDTETGTNTKTENDYIIRDPNQFVQEYNDYRSYKNIDNFTIISLIESNFFSLTGELVLDKSEFINLELFKTLMNLPSSNTIKILRLLNLQIKGRALKFLAKCRFMSLNQLEIDNCNKIDSLSIETFFNSPENVLKNMQKITLKRLNIEDSCITSIINAGQKMKNFNEFIICDCAHLSAKALDNLYSTKMISLTTLYLEKIQMEDSIFTKFGLSENLKCLENLSLIKIQGLDAGSLCEFFKSPYLSSLKYLEIRSIANIKGTFLAELEAKSTMLTNLYISDCGALSQDFLERFLKVGILQNLKALEISQMNQITDSFAQELANLHFSSLEELNLNHYLKLSASTLVSLLSSNLTNTIRVLSLENCTGLIDFPNNLSSLSKCNLEKLERLNLNFCTKISSYLLQGITSIGSLKNLKALSLNGIFTLDDVSCMGLAKSTVFQNITELYLENCPNLTIRSIQELMRSVMTVNIEVLSLDGNSQLNDEIWNFITNSRNLKKLKELRLKGLAITSDGVDKLIYSEKMTTIEILHLTDACFAFPSFYNTEKCAKLKKIEGSWDNVTSEEVENLLQSTSLSPEFQFQDITNKVLMDRDIMMALPDSIFLKKIWEFPQFDIRDIDTSAVEKLLLSKNLNPFFNLDNFLKEMKAIINDAILEAMAENPLCVNNLFELDLLGCKNVTDEGIKNILSSKYLCPLFNISGFIQNIKYNFANQASSIIPLIAKGNFSKFIKKLDLGDYELENGLLRKHLLLKPNVFKNLRTINLSRTQIDDQDIIALAENDLISLLIVLNLSNNPSISTEGFKIFLNLIDKKKLLLKRIDVDYCKINNEHLTIFSSSSFAKNIRHFSLAGCKDVDGEGLQQILNLYTNNNRKINIKKIYEDFKHYIDYDGKKYTIKKEIDADPNEIYAFLKNINDGKGKKSDNEKKRILIRDKVILTLLKEKRIENLLKIDINNTAITAKILVEIANCPFLKSLKELDLQNTNIDDEGVRLLCTSPFLRNLKRLDLSYCNLLTKITLINILNADFHKFFNPDQILSHFSPKIDSEILKFMMDSKYFFNFYKLNLTQNNDFTINDLKNLMEMLRRNENLSINLNLNLIFERHKSELSDDLLIEISNSKILSVAKSLELAGANIGEEGLQAIFVSKYINPNFKVQLIINSFANLIDDDFLNAISRGLFFRNITELNLKNCPKITILGLLNIARSPNPDFYIQGLIDDFGDKIDSLFIKNMVQQDYFENITNLQLTNCKRLTTNDLLTVIKASHEDFELEKFIKPSNLPNTNPDLITNEVIKAISQSPYFIRKYIEENPNDDDRSYFDFNIRLYRQVDFGINYLIESNTAPIEDYDDYLQNFSFYLTYKSLDMINKISKKGDNKEDVKNLKEQLSHVTKMDFSQNKQIYNLSFKSRLTEAFEGFQNIYSLNLENDTVDYFVNNVIKVQDDINMTSDLNEEFKDLIIFDLIKRCQNLEEINLNNLNLGDYFLKRFSLYISEEKQNKNLPQLKVFKIRNNGGFTSVGLKYLFCAAVTRSDIEYIDVSFKGQITSGITYFVNYGLKGMVDYELFYSWNILKTVYNKKKRKIFKFLFNKTTISIFGLYFLTSPILAFHLLEKIIFLLPFFLSRFVRPLRPLYKYYKKCVNSCCNCFGDFMNQSNKERENSSMYRQGSMSMISLTPSSNTYVKSKTVMRKKKSCCTRWFCSCFLKSKTEYETQIVHRELRQRYSRSMNNLQHYVGKDYENIKSQSLFYFDESLIALNEVLGNKNNFLKQNVVVPGFKLDNLTKFKRHILQKFHLISHLKLIFVLNFFAYYALTLFYLIFLKLTFNQDADLYSQIPYFIYGGVTFIIEFILCWEVIKIINSPMLINIRSGMLISNLISSQFAKYDLFTDTAFVLSKFDYNPETHDYAFGYIFIASLAILSFKIFLNFKEFLGFLGKNFCKRRQRNASYSSKYINFFSKTCFSFEFFGLGRLLDKFSTASAQKYRYWWLPKSLYNMYVPMVITATFTRLFIEDIPQLIIQTIDITNLGTLNFTTLTALGSTIGTLFLTLHTAWNVKPSYFSRDLFKLYHDTLMKANNNEDESISETSSHMDNSAFDESEHRSQVSFEGEDNLENLEKGELTPPIINNEEKEEDERDELFGAAKIDN